MSKELAYEHFRCADQRVALLKREIMRDSDRGVTEMCRLARQLRVAKIDQTLASEAYHAFHRH